MHNDPATMPPPDLAVEVEVTSPLLNKMPVYAGLGIAELWHIGETGRARILTLSGNAYEEAATSPAIPFFNAESLNQWLGRRLKGEHLATLQAFLGSLHGNHA